MKARIFSAVFLIVLVCCLTACGTASTTPPQKTDDSDTPAAPLTYASVEELVNAPGIRSVKIVDHAIPSAPDPSQLSPEAAEQYRVFSEDFTTWEIRYTVDSAIVTAYISAPKTYTDTPVSLILYARGGNGTYGANQPQSVAAYAFQSGCAVIASNYRAADEFGGADVNDVVFWLDLIPALDFVVPEEVYMIGESRGGMQTCLTLLQDKQSVIRGAACISGLYDVAGIYEQRSDMQEMLVRRIGGTPSECSAEYEKRSAVTFADQIETPLLLIHSTGDVKVPYEQGKAFADALEKHEKTYVLITRDDAYHGISSGTEMQNILAWLRENGK